MPSLLVSSPQPDETMKSKSKKSKGSDSMEVEKKKSKKHQKLESEEGEVEMAAETSSKKERKEKKEKKKRKKESDDEASETSSDSDLVALNKKPKIEDPNAIVNFRISDVLRERLKSKGIESLFPIQAMTFDLILDGNDLVGRARTGQGKTLAFVLPILESLTNGKNKDTKRTGYGRPPSVLVLLPTRELANQVHADFEFYGGAVGLTSCCIYGGTPYRTQEMALKKGVDIVVGAPGRIKDHLERGNLNLKNLKFRVLDEADEMLNMGFVDDVELILGKVEDVTKVQTLLFSATLPQWVQKLQKRFLKDDKKVADLVGNERLKASASVRHLVLPCNSAAMPQIIPDLIRCYSHGGRTIIFTETKESASALGGLISGARALHGDIVQAQREVILAGFRSGRFQVLVATNVAARGLDISDVQLVIQCEAPRDVEAYIHRSGRTGRAGNSGVAIVLYEPRQKRRIATIERESGVKFEHISAPQPADVAESAGSEAADAISNVSDSVVPVFQKQAEELLNSSGMTPLELLAKALAKAAGYTDIKKRSILSSMDNYATLLLKAGKAMYTPSFAFTTLRRILPDEKISAIKGMSLTADGMGAVFDVPCEDVDTFVEAQENGHMITIEVLETLPPLQEKDEGRGGYSGGRRFGGGGNRFGGRGGGGGGGRGGGGNRFGGRGGGGRFGGRRN
ncbi:hypothetical protein LUZ61_019830 [Rhynchospora tenuis]|uniref:DEAD-box ATP-dependent RNA helicase 7 n=1 Tax=Rhynchospora tenuis TaxID=198213 RepID=A0AAD5ZC42_9POAL|nr:hypothetical protein LUZ61_019830 [Rhynchospora tenuis]